MIEYGAEIKLFYPMLLFTIGAIGIFLICSIKTILIKFKDKDSQDFRFKAHIDEHIDTTNKLSKAHTEIIEIKWDETHEKELHKLEEIIKDINNQLDILTKRVVILENKNNKIDI